MTSLAVLAWANAAFAALCLAMPRHRSGTARTSRALRIAGSVALAGSAVLAMQSQGIGVGLVLWFAASTLAAVCVVLCAAYRPQALAPLGKGALLCGVTAAVLPLLRAM